MFEIESLLPHREPFLFADKIISVDNQKIVGITKFEDKPYVLEDHEHVHEVILLESMAQIGGAGAKILLNEEGLFGLVKIVSASFKKVVHKGEQVYFIIKNSLLSNRLIKQSGTGFVNDEEVIEACWVCGRMK